nr:capsular polysaccharide synthesis protein [Turicibacter sp. HGF1]
MLWQKKTLRKIKKYICYKDDNPSNIIYSTVQFDNPIWVYWDGGIETAPIIIKKCYESLIKYHGDKVVLLTEKNLKDYIQLPSYIEEKRNNGSIPIAGYTDLMRFALLEHYGGTWIDATIYLTDYIPEEIINCDFFAFQNSLGLLSNPVLFPAWFLHANKNSKIIREIRNVAFAYWKNEKHVIEYLLPNLIITSLISDEDYKKMPYMNSDYSEYLIKVLGDEYSEDKMQWIKKLTCIHKLTYKLDNSIDKEDTFYKHITT